MHHAGQVEDSRRAYTVAPSPEEAQVLKKQAMGQEPLRRKPAPLTIEAEDAAIAEHTRRPQRSSSRARVKVRPKQSSSAQVSPSVTIRAFLEQRETQSLALS